MAKNSYTEGITSEGISYAEGYNTTCVGGSMSHAEGYFTTAFGGETEEMKREKKRKMRKNKLDRILNDL